MDDSTLESLKSDTHSKAHAGESKHLEKFKTGNKTDEPSIEIREKSMVLPRVKSKHWETSTADAYSVKTVKKDLIPPKKTDHEKDKSIRPNSRKLNKHNNAGPESDGEQDSVPDTNYNDIEETSDRVSVLIPDRSIIESRYSRPDNENKNDAKSVDPSSSFNFESKINMHLITTIDQPGKKKKVRRTKHQEFNPMDQQEAVKEALDDLWKISWSICLDRFYQGNGPTSISLQLRDTWLRIMEIEWMDADVSVDTVTDKEILPRDFFIEDEPPLPLTYDTWSRGALEIFPEGKIESVLDPFMRDTSLIGEAGDGQENKISFSSKNLMDMNEPIEKAKSKSLNDLPQFNFTGDYDNFKNQNTFKPKKSKISKSISTKSVLIRTKSLSRKKVKISNFSKKTIYSPDSLEDDEDDDDENHTFEIAENNILLAPTNSEETLNASIIGAGEEIIIDELARNKVKVLPDIDDDDKIEIVFPPKVSSKLSDFNLSFESLLEARLIESKSSVDINEKYRKLGIVPWSPSHCGGRNGRSGVFRLINETSSQVIRMTRPEYHSIGNHHGYGGQESDGAGIDHDNPFSLDEAPMDKQSTPTGKRKSVLQRLVLSSGTAEEKYDDFSTIDILKPDELYEYSNLRQSSLKEQEKTVDGRRKTDETDTRSNPKSSNRPHHPRNNRRRFTDEELMASQSDIFQLKSSDGNPHPNTFKLTKSEKVFFENKMNNYRAKMLRQNQMKSHATQEYHKEFESKANIPFIHKELRPSPSVIKQYEKTNVEKLATKGIIFPNFQSETNAMRNKAILKRHSIFASKKIKEEFSQKLKEEINPKIKEEINRKSQNENVKLDAMVEGSTITLIGIEKKKEDKKKSMKYYFHDKLNKTKSDHQHDK